MTSDAGDPTAQGTARPQGGIADRLWPALLDRLTDFEPEKKKEAREARVMSRKGYRDGVLRDLQWLLNATNLDASIDFSGHPDAQRSVVNFGLAALSGRLASNVDTVQLEATIRQAIVQFEPRILPQSLEVKVAASEKSLDMHNVLAVTIRGELWAIPYPLEILLRSDIDLETGQVVLHDQSRGE